MPRRARQMAEANRGVGVKAVEDPGRTRRTIGASVTGASAAICSSGTPPRFNTEDETAEPSSEDLISPCPTLDATIVPITLRTHKPSTLLLQVIGVTLAP